MKLSIPKLKLITQTIINFDNPEYEIADIRCHNNKSELVKFIIELRLLRMKFKSETEFIEYCDNIIKCAKLLGKEIHKDQNFYIDDDDSDYIWLSFMIVKTKLQTAKLLGKEIHKDENVMMMSLTFGNLMNQAIFY